MKSTLRALLLLFFFAGSVTTFAQNTAGAGYCLGLNGSSQYVAIPHNTSLNSATALTLEAWVYPAVFAANSWGNVIIGKDGWGQGEAGYSLRCGGNGSLSFNIGSTTSWHEVLVNNVLTTNTWHHVAGTFDGSVMRLYVNGKQVGSTNYSGSILNSTYDVNIGRIPFTSGGTRHFQGEIDEVRIWRSALSTTVLRDWMCRKVTASHPNYAQLGGNWRFDDAMGNTLTDLSPNANNGTLVSGPIWGFSGAAIGDTSVHTYTAPFNLNLNGASPVGDFAINLTSGTPDGIHLYQINGGPNFVNLPTGYSGFFTSSYWGVFLVDNSSAVYDVYFNYNGNAQINSSNECNVALAGRLANNSSNWYDLNASLDITMDEVFRSNQGQQQYILGLNPQPYPLVPLTHLQFCQGDSVRMETNIGTGNTYAWYRNGILIPSVTGIGYTALQSGDYHVVVTDGPCSYSTDTMTVNVLPPPAISQQAIGPFCINDSALTLTGTTPTGGTYSGPGASGNQFDPLLAGLGNTPLIYTYTDTNMCAASDTQMVTVNPTPFALFNNPADICENDPALALTTGIPSGGTYSGPGVSANTFYPGSSGAGTFMLAYLFSDPNGCSDMDSATIIVHPAPATPVVTVNGNTFTSSAPSGNQWLNGGMAIPGATGTTFTATATGSYSVYVLDSNGCTSGTSMVFSYVGIGIANGPLLELFPNPARDQVTLRWQQESPGALRIELLDAIGKLIYQEVDPAANSGLQARTFSLADLPAGMYFVRLETPLGATRRLLVKQ